MTNHYYIYLGRENGKRVIHKVGQTRQTCYARCKSADYRIGCAFEIVMPENYPVAQKRKTLNEIEQCIIYYFESNFKLEHGREYFRTSKKYWEQVKPMFVEEMKFIIKDVFELDYVYHEGWVTANSY
jgi:hypothetical protein